MKHIVICLEKPYDFDSYLLLTTSKNNLESIKISYDDYYYRSA